MTTDADADVDVIVNLANRFLRPRWMDWGACNGKDPEEYDFFSGRVKDQQKCIDELCHACAVEDLCGQYALDEDIRDGVWGGLTEAERRKMRGRDDHIAR